MPLRFTAVKIIVFQASSLSQSGNENQDVNDSDAGWSRVLEQE